MLFQSPNIYIYIYIYTHNATLRHFRESLLSWKSNNYYIFASVCACVSVSRRVCVCMRVRKCGLASPLCNSQAPYFEINCKPSGFYIFFGIFSQTARFSKKRIEHKMCFFDFLYKVCLNHFSF
jgi:hypothetical protein